MKWAILACWAFLLSGCLWSNECGLSTHYYNDCVEYYDSMGIYHKKCPKNNVTDRCERKPSVDDCVGCN